LPEDIDLSVNPRFKVYLFPYENRTAGSAFRIRIGELRYIADTEIIDKTIDQNNLDNQITVSNTLRTVATFEQTLNGSLMAAGDWVSGELERRPADAGDDRNGDCGIFLLEFIYTANKLGG
jgi:hypothetical protein